MVCDKKDGPSKKHSSVTTADWPGALPLPQEEKVFSIVCGNTSLKWAFHDGADESFQPTCTWTTQLIDKTDVESPTTTLCRLLPEPALRFVFGSIDTQEPDLYSALQKSYCRSATLLTVYMISTNTENADNLAWCFSELPARLYSLNPDDFYTMQQGRYETMGMDRLACMLGAASEWGYPMMVIDGGTSMTYTAADRNENIVGGGIIVGTLPRLRTLAAYSKDAPGMTSIQEPEEMYRSLLSLARKNEPLLYFQRDTKSAVLSTLLKEIGLLLHQVIKKYLEDIYYNGEVNEDDGEGKGTGESSSNSGQQPEHSKKSIPTIVVTGGDAAILECILKTNENNMFEQNPAVSPYTVVKCSHLIALGVAAVLNHEHRSYMESPNSEADKKFLGCRLAKEFRIPDVDGNRIYRGTLCGSVRAKNGSIQYFQVVYDDGDWEEMDAVQLHAALMLYSNVGEKVVGMNSEHVSKRLTEKKVSADSIAKSLEVLDPKVKDNAEANRKTAAATAAEANPTIQGKKPVAAARVEGGPPKPDQKPPASFADDQTLKRKQANPATTTAKKINTKKTIADPTIDPLSKVNCRIAKRFGSQIFFGTVSNYDSSEKLWRIDYDDGDEEEFDKDELIQYLRFYESNKDVDQKG